MFILFKEAIEFDDIGMFQAAMESDLGFKLINHFILFNFTFDDFFQGKDSSCFQMSCQINLSKFTLSKLL